MKNLWNFIIIVAAVIFAYLIVSYIKEWWPWDASSTTVMESPSPSYSATPLPSGAYYTNTPAPTYGSGITVSDTTYNYTVVVPSNWSVRKREGATNKQLSYIEVQSPDFAVRSEQGPDGAARIYYDNGALLMIDVVKGSYSQPHELYGSNPRVGVKDTKYITIDGNSATYHEFVHPTTYGGELLDVHIIRNNKTYLLTFAYNPANTDGKRIFESIYNSFRFADQRQGL